MSICPPLQTELRVPGDKSISHRALLLSGITEGESQIIGLADNADVQATRACLTQLGVSIADTPSGLLIQGRPYFQQPSGILDACNSGTTMRLMSGILAAQRFPSIITGDASLQKRPMGRVITPLTQMGAHLEASRDGQFAPLSIQPAPQPLQGLTYELPHASAQVKSAILLAGLYAQDETRVVEPTPSRDHTERMLAAAGIELTHQGNIWILPGGQIQALRPQTWHIPGDPSSAAFWLVAGSLIPGSRVRIRGISLNPTRTGIVEVLQAAGADIRVENETLQGGEPVGDWVVHAARLHGDVVIDGALVPRLIDELPILGVVGALMEGSLTVRGAEELRKKESDRIAALAEEFGKLGIPVEEFADGFRIEGPIRGIAPRATLNAHHDHRIAMSLMVLNRIVDPATRWPMDTEDGREWAAVSYPTFEAELFEGLPA